MMMEARRRSQVLLLLLPGPSRSQRSWQLLRTVLMVLVCGSPVYLHLPRAIGMHTMFLALKVSMRVLQ
jgi:hypothetical protein